jgi:hypothetical protein
MTHDPILTPLTFRSSAEHMNMLSVDLSTSGIKMGVLLRP